MKQLMCLICVCGICCFLIGEAMADVIHSGTYTYSVAPSAAISGYSGDVGNAGPIAYTTSSILGDNTQGALSTACWNNGSNALGSGGVTITFDLETEYNIGEVNVNCGLANSYWCVGAVYFRYSTDGVIYTDLGSDGSSEYGPGVRTRSYDYGAVAAQYIQVQVLSNHWYHLGVSDVEISGTPVPEPMTLCLLGLGSLGFFRRRR